MDLRTAARTAGLLGGLCWIARVVLDRADIASGLDALYWSGIVLLAVALAATGAGLVSRSAIWLRLVVAVAVPLLVWSVLEVMRPSADPLIFDGVVGGVVLLLALIGWLRSRPDKDSPRTPRPHKESRAARAKVSGSHAR